MADDFLTIKFIDPTYKWVKMLRSLSSLRLCEVVKSHPPALSSRHEESGSSTFHDLGFSVSLSEAQMDPSD